jgi:L-ascorbate metabolism protein UlaG (beta-lactamase superfamily)
MDPYGPETGRELPRLAATVVTVSHDDAAHNYSRTARGRPYVIQGPGEYEVGGIFITGVQTYHDDRGGSERGPNTAYVVEFDDLIVCHLGALGHVLTREQVDEIEQNANVDVLLIPVGGRTVLAGGRAVEVVSQLEPSIVIPMHYKVRGLNTEGETTTRFLREMGADEVETVETLDVRKSRLPEQTQVVLMEPVS